ncbi:MAG: DUF2442 domain-containing protein [Candidatus Omnitrophica bacterium]|nr:DUF2442 domain-containing protein [Candidatus Omnitrophota bacterium]
MKSQKRGAAILKPEVSHISPHGIWLYVNGREYFLSYEDFPWFKEGRLSEIQNVEFHHSHLLRWEDLDIDLDLDCLENPGKYPLKFT